MLRGGDAPVIDAVDHSFTLQVIMFTLTLQDGNKRKFKDAPRADGAGYKEGRRASSGQN